MIGPGPGAAYASSRTHPSCKRHHMAHEGYGGLDSDVQRLARSTLVEISASDSPASGSASGAPKAHVACSSIRRGTTPPHRLGKRLTDHPDRHECSTARRSRWEAGTMVVEVAPRRWAILGTPLRRSSSKASRVPGTRPPHPNKQGLTQETRQDRRRPEPAREHDHR